MDLLHSRAFALTVKQTLKLMGLPVISLCFNNQKSAHPVLAKDLWEIHFQIRSLHPSNPGGVGFRRMYDDSLRDLIRRAFHSLQEDLIREKELEFQRSRANA